MLYDLYSVRTSRLEFKMSSAVATTIAVTAPVKVAKKKTASAKPKKVADHPKYAEMVKYALTNLKVSALY